MDIGDDHGAVALMTIGRILGRRLTCGLKSVIDPVECIK
jgi:hypothetical protein